MSVESEELKLKPFVNYWEITNLIYWNKLAYIVTIWYHKHNFLLFQQYYIEILGDKRIECVLLNNKDRYRNQMKM